MKSRLENDTKLILSFRYRETHDNLQTWNRNELKCRVNSKPIPMSYVTIVNICYLDITNILMNKLHSLFLCSNEINKN